MLVGAAALLFAASATPVFIDAAQCAACHPKISETYSRTGMARSFYRVNPKNTPDAASYYHAASERHFEIRREKDRYFMRRREDGGMEKSIDYVLGSGNHARSYVSRAADGRLAALPLAWYAERGGFWAMAPGYDRPDHADFRREIGFDCMFCHNGYPEMPAGADAFGKPPLFPGRIPEGIDCQRCHGPGSAHVEAARAGAARDRIRSSIVSPSRLSHNRQLDVCFQCHLQSTSRRLPFAIRRYDRAAFSYRAGEPLRDYMLHFDLAPEAERSKTFEVVSAGSRFLESRCYQASGGKLTCTTCHNPHDVPRGAAAVTHYATVCRQCHEAPRHTIAVSNYCAGCHMPKRRTDDAVHVIMTDHLIQRQHPAGDLLAQKPELHERDDNSRLGRVTPLYPPKFTDELYEAVAQLREAANLVEGIPRLEAALARLKPKEAGSYYDLAEALRNSGRPLHAIRWYEQALARSRDLAPALRGLGAAYHAAGQPQRAIGVLERAAVLDTNSVETLNAFGTAYKDSGRLADAVSAFRRAIAANPEMPEPHLNLGVTLASIGDAEASIAEFREAIRLRPDLAAAHNNLALQLDGRGETNLARTHFDRAVRLSPAYAAARHNYGLYLAKQADWRAAREQLEKAVALDPSVAGHTNLATVLAKLGDSTAAIDQYERALALNATFEHARLNLARTLITAGRKADALPHLAKLTTSTSAETRAAARELLKIAAER
ncbi:MAG TPA: tetratricopeptide repeat protein [Bryobacteraceae bacterium]|nr:tetratricopeptide repeat protein [Bryobacteraceae bacterium]